MVEAKKRGATIRIPQFPLFTKYWITFDQKTNSFESNLGSQYYLFDLVNEKTAHRPHRRAEAERNFQAIKIWVENRHKGLERFEKDLIARFEQSLLTEKPKRRFDLSLND